MRWQLFFICALWCFHQTYGRNLLRPETIHTTTEEPFTTTDSLETDFTTTIDPDSTSEPIASPEPIMPEVKIVPKRLLRSVPFIEEPGLPVVTIPQGTVVGSAASDGDYFEFYGIPYADSTSGTNRFKAPSPPPNFQHAFTADRKNIKCVRALGVGYEGTEDCLVVNIFTPSISNTSQLPVMVWIKGKEFDSVNEPELSFKNFVERDVIVVSLNYRESVLGFLCLGTQTAPGNAGLKDIVAGLRWVKNNIVQFGGNPNDITLFGHGSGAAAVDLITLSPMANGLVNKAISQSGNAMAPWAVSRDNLRYAVDVAEALGHIVTNIEDLSHIFERTSVAALMAVINELELTENALAFSPCIEKEDLEGVEPFLTKTPFDIISNGEFLPIPFITGFVENEGTIRAEEAIQDDWLQRMEDGFSNFLQSDLQFETNAERNEVAQQIRRFYFEEDPINLSTLNKYIAYHGETIMIVSSIREVRARAQATEVPTYMYIFSYKGALGDPFVGPVELETAGHSEELAYLFYGDSDDASDWDLAVANILIDRWTNFAKTGNPSTEISPITWRPFTSSDPAFLRIIASVEVPHSEVATLERVLTNPHSVTISFWDEIYEEHFLDAQSNWKIIERTEDDEEIEGSGEEGSGDDGSGDGGSGDDGSGDGGSGDDGSGDGGSGDDGSGDDGTGGGGNSATTVVGYTFTIITLFSLLSKFHLYQLTP